MRGATWTKSKCSLFTSISIHAPHAGRDSVPTSSWSSILTFQSTRPMRGATEINTNLATDIKDFNPRTPCGVRPLCNRWTIGTSLFQSTHPLRGATSTRRKSRSSSIFQSTHPLRGATRSSFWAELEFLFQSTHPLRGATEGGGVTYMSADISIHAPLAGCDAGDLFYRPAGQNFNPRTPCGVRH